MRRLRSGGERDGCVVACRIAPVIELTFSAENQCASNAGFPGQRYGDAQFSHFLVTMRRKGVSGIVAVSLNANDLVQLYREDPLKIPTNPA